MGAEEGGRREEYLARIHRVQDYVETHLDQELSLRELAAVACFSPFHFHRIFSAMVGEPLHRFVLRLRLEKAASQLLHNPKKSVTEVALDCGFGGSAAFARAFRAEFGMSGSEWRRRCEAERRGAGMAGSKKRKTVGKEGKDQEQDLGSTGDGVRNGPDVTTSRREPMPIKTAESVRIEETTALNVAYVRHVGPYAGDAELFKGLFGKLMSWAGPRGLLRFPETRMLCVYHDNPDVTEPEKLRVSACITVPKGTPAEGEVGTMEVPGGRYAFAHFEIDPSEYGAAWAWVYGTWLPSSGYQPDDRPCFELYLNDPNQHPEHKHVVEIVAPVRPL